MTDLESLDVYVVLLQDHERNKLQSRSCLCCFLRYGIGQKGYRCYDPISKHLRVSRHVVFWEHKMFYQLPYVHVSPIPSIDPFPDLFPEESPTSMFEQTTPPPPPPPPPWSLSLPFLFMMFLLMHLMSFLHRSLKCASYRLPQRVHH